MCIYSNHGGPLLLARQDGKTEAKWVTNYRFCSCVDPRENNGIDYWDSKTVMQ